MTRDIFERVVAKALRQSAGQSPEQQAVAVANLMETVTELMGDAPTAAPAPKSVSAPWPSINPEAVAPVIEEPVSAERTEPEPSLIIPATRIPDHVEPVDAPKPVTLRAIPQARLKVEELSALIQQRTPDHLTVQVPTPDGPRVITLVRNVISMHAMESVQLVYYPPNTSIEVREATQVSANLHVDDVPIDLSKVLKKLAEQAVNTLKPREGPIASTAPALTSGPVRHAGDTYGAAPEEKAALLGVQAVFNALPKT